MGTPWYDDNRAARATQYLILEKVRVECSRFVSAALLSEFRLSADRRDGPGFASFMADGFTYALHGYLYGSKPKVRAIKRTPIPATWWDALKLRIAEVVYRHGGYSDHGLAEWIRGRVRYREIPVTHLHQNICPHVNLVPPRYGRDVHFAFLERRPVTTWDAPR